jgi:hypothetical protein
VALPVALPPPVILDPAAPAAFEVVV